MLLKFLHLLPALIFVAGCNRLSPEPKFARERNADRVERLLPIIEASWENFNRGNNLLEAAWRVPNFNSAAGKAMHAGKKVLYPKGTLEAEEDYYYSGKTFDGSTIDPDSGQAWEELVIHYDYRHPESPWRCSLIHAEGIDTISLQAAEDILQSWSLQRLTGNK